MLRIYCDKNIYSSIKPGKNNFNSELKSLMDELKDIVIFTYSSAHHWDLSNSESKYWDEDLLLMENYVNDNYFNYEPIKKMTECLLAKPIESFYDIDFDKAKNIQSLDEIKESLYQQSENDYNDFFKSFFDTLMNLPLPDFDLSGNTDKENEKIRKYLPENKNLTIGKLLDHQLKLGAKLLNDSEEIKQMKKMMEEYVSSENYSFEKWRDDYDKKFGEFLEGTRFTEMMEKIFENVRNYNDYDKFKLFFGSLDVFNITKDKPLRKTQALSSTLTDADHAWFASFSDFLITADKGLAAKAYITYKYFDIQTKIFDITEFLNYKNIFFNQEELRIEAFIKTLNYELKNGLIVNQSDDNSCVIQTNHVFFNYFNMIVTNRNSETFYCRRNGNANFTMFNEIELLSKKIVQLFGIDNENKGVYNHKTESLNKIIRQWDYENARILFFQENSRINSLCLRILFNENQNRK